MKKHQNIKNRYTKVPAPPEHQRRTGEPFIVKTLIKRCTKCLRYRPHWCYLETKSLDGLGSTCDTCRSAAYESKKASETAEQRNARLNRQYEYYDDNPLYYKWTAKARYLEKKAEKNLQEAQLQEDWQRANYPEAPFYSSKRTFAHAYLLEAKKLRRKAGKPTR